MFRDLNLDVVSQWPPGNYANPSERRGPAVYIVIGIFVTLSTSTLFTRMYSRVWIRRYFGADDALIIFAWMASLGVMTCAILGHHKYGWDKHIWDINPTIFPHSLQMLYVARICWGVATSSVRLSICFLYLRLLNRIGVGKSRFRTVLYGFTGLQIALFFVYVFSGIFPCRPVRAYWSLSQIPGQHCDKDTDAMKACAVMNTVFEFILATFPIIAVFKLNVDHSQRWTVISVLSLGFLVGLAGCFRTFFLWKAMSVANLDMTWWADPHMIASEVEINLAITCACAAPLKPFISYCVRKIKGLPSQLPTIRGLRPSLSTSNSKRSEADYDWRAGFAPPRHQYFDLEGLPCDGYGYTVVISGPARKRSLLHKRRTVKETPKRDQMMMKNAAPIRSNTSSQFQRADSRSALRESKNLNEKEMTAGISSVRNSHDRHSWNWPRISHTPKQSHGTIEVTSSFTSKQSYNDMTSKSGQSWLADV